ncbi:MAG: MoaD/ThiS family protein [Spirochaetaceae bacterium]|jgi:adenylyltransferase/sulfurtransferase|nr:MoaD/ThiS family protein [Spirochaetaceae bacterium]
MAISIMIPTALRNFTGRKAEVAVNAATVKEALDALAAEYPDLATHIFENGELRSFINVYVGEANIKTLKGIATELQDGSELMLVPAIAGG